MTDDDRDRIATRAARGISLSCGKPIRQPDRSHRPCRGTLKMTGVVNAAPALMIRCTVCDSYRIEDDE